jgi:hypothetical protein
LSSYDNISITNCNVDLASFKVKHPLKRVGSKHIYNVKTVFLCGDLGKSPVYTRIPQGLEQFVNSFSQKLIACCSKRACMVLSKQHDYGGESEYLYLYKRSSSREAMLMHMC